jgi:endo-1,3-1,4-beta-glycanase ExoK
MTTKQRLEGTAGAQWHRALPGLLTLGCLCALLATSAWAAGPRTRLPTAQKSFVDQLDAYDTRRWTKADGWVNGSPFANAWRADHVTFQAGSMHLVLSSQAYLGMAYSSGELRTKGFYGYGCYEARFKPVKRAGVVTSFFTFAGPFDNGGNGRHNEIDIEFVGDDTEAVQLNFWANDDRYISRNERRVDLGFDASLAAHNYGFKWTSKRIEWFLDGVALYAVDDSAGNPIPKATQSLQKIMMNVWPVDDTAASWAGTFVYPGSPLRAEYEFVRYTSGENCTFGG